MSPAGRTVLRALVSLGLLLILAQLVDPAMVVDRLRSIDPQWLTAGLALCALQFIASAERWRRTAQALRVPLSRRRALADYYLAGFANQVLPGGVLGDAARALRHAQTSGHPGPAVRAVVLERASGQAVLLAVMLVLTVTTPTGRQIAGELLGSLRPAAWFGLIAALVVGALLIARHVLARAADRFGWWTALIEDARSALLCPRRAPMQLALSLVVVLALCGTFICAARMLGADVPASMLLVLAPLVLLAMLIPISVGGWGLRESAAAALFALAGQSAETGVAISIGYGLVTLLAALPGALVPLVGLQRRSPTA